MLHKVTYLKLYQRRWWLELEVGMGDPYLHIKMKYANSLIGNCKMLMMHHIIIDDRAVR